VFQDKITKAVKSFLEEIYCLPICVYYEPIYIVLVCYKIILNKFPIIKFPNLPNGKPWEKMFDYNEHVLEKVYDDIILYHKKINIIRSELKILENKEELKKSKLSNGNSKRGFSSPKTSNPSISTFGLEKSDTYAIINDLDLSFYSNLYKTEFTVNDNQENIISDTAMVIEEVKHNIIDNQSVSEKVTSMETDN
jgi:hypothetical protein